MDAYAAGIGKNTHMVNIGELIGRSRKVKKFKEET